MQITQIMQILNLKPYTLNQQWSYFYLRYQRDLMTKSPADFFEFLKLKP